MVVLVVLVVLVVVVVLVVQTAFKKVLNAKLKIILLFLFYYLLFICRLHDTNLGGRSSLSNLELQYAKKVVQYNQTVAAGGVR